MKHNFRNSIRRRGKSCPDLVLKTLRFILIQTISGLGRGDVIYYSITLVERSPRLFDCLYNWFPTISFENLHSCVVWCVRHSRCILYNYRKSIPKLAELTNFFNWLKLSCPTKKKKNLLSKLK